MFVPQALLDRHGIDRASIEARQNSPGLLAVLADMRGHARLAFAAFCHAAAELPERAAPAFLAVAIVPGIATPMQIRLKEAVAKPKIMQRVTVRKGSRAEVK